MRRVLFVLAVVIVLLVGPGLSVLADAPQGGVITDCRYSEPTAFGTGGATTGQIAERFSTLRSAPGAFSNAIVYSPAAFDVLDQDCIGGFSWVQIEYTSGTACNFSYNYWPYYGYGSCVNEVDATGMVGWALESQIYYDGIYGPGRWLEATAAQ